jgi:hypothetical protein
LARYFAFLSVHVHHDVSCDIDRTEPDASAATTCANEKMQTLSRGLEKENQAQRSLPLQYIPLRANSRWLVFLTVFSSDVA